MARKPSTRPAATPVAEWTAAALGALATLFAVGVIASEAARPSSPAAPRAEVRSVRPGPDGAVIEVRLTNAGDQTAAGVEVEGRAGLQTARARIDDLPGRGERTAFLSFPGLPAAGPAPEVRVLGWTEP